MFGYIEEPTGHHSHSYAAAAAAGASSSQPHIEGFEDEDNDMSAYNNSRNVFRAGSLISVDHHADEHMMIDKHKSHEALRAKMEAEGEAHADVYSCV